MNSIDVWLFLQLNANPETAPRALIFSRLVTEHLSTAAIVALGPIFLFGRSGRLQVKGVLLGMLAAWLIARGLREWIPSDRPFALGLGFQGLAHSASASFPSMHATMAGAWASGLILFSCPRARKGFVIMTLPVALLIGWSRIFLGLHFPSEILAGFLIGGTSSFFAYRVLRRALIHGD